MDPSLAFAVGIALVMTVLLAALCVNVGFRFAVVRTFAALALAVWTGGRSLSPFGPELWGIAWLPYVVAGLTAAAGCIGFMVLSGCMTRAICEQLDSLAAGRRAIGALNPDRILTIEHGRSSGPLLGS